VAGDPHSTDAGPAGVRDVAIPPHLLPAVKARLKNHTGKDKTRCSSRPPQTATPTWRRRRSTRSTTRPGRPPAARDLRWHDLRHTGAVLAAQTGATLAELMGRLGHSTPGAGMRYQHAAADRGAEIARRVSALIEG